MKTHKDNVMEKEMILTMINLLNQHSSRIYSEAKNLAEKAYDEIDQFNMEVKQLGLRLDTVGQSILHMIHGPEEGVLEFLQAEEEALCNLQRIKTNLEGIKGILDPNTKLYN